MATLKMSNIYQSNLLLSHFTQYLPKSYKNYVLLTAVEMQKVGVS